MKNLNNEEIKMTLGERLSLLRYVNKISQRVMAIHCGINERTYKNWEHGLTTPTNARLLVIAEKFHVEPAWLILGTGNVIL